MNEKGDAKKRRFSRAPIISVTRLEQYDLFFTPSGDVGENILLLDALSLDDAMLRDGILSAPNRVERPGDVRILYIAVVDLALRNIEGIKEDIILVEVVVRSAGTIDRELVWHGLECFGILYRHKPSASRTLGLHQSAETVGSLGAGCCYPYVAE